MSRVMLTTIDNPYSPFDDFSAWYQFDVAAGYHTSDFVARLLQDSDALSETDFDLAIELAVDEAVRENVLGIYKKVMKPD